MVSGIVLALFEVFFIFLGGAVVRHSSENLKMMNIVAYYWLVLTVVTGFLWETSYIANYQLVGNYSLELIEKDESVWTNNYELWNVLPNYFAVLFYSTYAAWADREYMSTTDDWSRVVESSHAVFCGVFSLLVIINYAFGKNNEFLITLGISMGSQIMNSLLYMVEYFIQCKDPNNVNYNSDSFPMGIMLSKRAFMWINTFWLLLPTYTLVYYLWINRSDRRALTPVSPYILEKGELDKLN